jgi:hypothetical protein
VELSNFFLTVKAGVPPLLLSKRKQRHTGYTTKKENKPHHSVLKTNYKINEKTRNKDKHG